MAKKKVGGLTISIVAERYEVHPQTLRSYEREGLLWPSRTKGNTRLYTEEDLEQLELIPDIDARIGGQPGRRGGRPPHAQEDAANAR